MNAIITFKWEYKIHSAVTWMNKDTQRYHYFKRFIKSKNTFDCFYFRMHVFHIKSRKIFFLKTRKYFPGKPHTFLLHANDSTFGENKNG